MTSVTLPVSVGEAVDKYSILEIKKSQVRDKSRLEHIEKEIAAIFPFVDQVIRRYAYHYSCLHYVNKQIWDLSEKIRDDSISDSDKTGLYAETFTWNDARFRIKSKINTLLSSTLKEQKSYGLHCIEVNALSSVSDYEKYGLHIRYLSLRYDRVYIRCDDALLRDIEAMFQDDPHIIVGTHEEGIHDAEGTNTLDLTTDDINMPSSFESLTYSPEEPTLTYVVGGKLGDFIHLLYVVMCKYLSTGMKGQVFITDDLRYGGDGFTTDATTVYSEIHSVVEAQPYIDSFSVLPPGQTRSFDVNLNDFRKHGILWTMGWLNFLPRIFNTPFLLGPWIDLPRRSEVKDVIYIHRSRMRAHQNPSFIPFLRTIATNNICKFLTCSPKEYEEFPLKDIVPLERVHTLEEIYTKINSCTLFIGNQSSPFAIAYSLGKPCLCESTQCRFYTDPHRPPNTFYWESEQSSFLEGIDKYVKRNPEINKMSFYGQFHTDKAIQKYFPEDYVGTCVDVGMAEPISGSNTYHFEENGWTCLCVEPNTTYCEQAKGIRKHVENLACGAEHADDQTFDIYTINGNNQTAISSLKPDDRLIKSHMHMINTVHTIKVNVRTLDEVLSRHPYIESIDFLSIDTENTELDVLKGFDIARWKPKLFVIENNYDEPFLGDYLKDFGYKRVERVGVNDFFVPCE